jgi:hypothetical protein
MTPSERAQIEMINSKAGTPGTPSSFTCADLTDIATLENWDELYAELVPRARQDVLEQACRQREHFDLIIADLIERGERAEGWIAFKQWAFSQREVLEAPARRLLTDEQVSQFFAQTHYQSIQIAKNRLAHVQATTDEERAQLDREMDEMEARFERDNKALKASFRADPPT